MLTHRGLFKSTLLSFNKLGFFCSSSPPVQAQALSRDSGLFILCHWSELRDEELILKQFSVCCLFCFFWSFSSFFHAAFSAVRSLQGLHLLNPPPWIFTSLVALLNSAGWGGGGMSQLLQQEKVCENCIMQHLHLQWIKSSRFIHCFRTCQSPLNQITAFTQLRITPDAVSVWHSVILDEEREEKREKGKGKKVFLYLKWPIPSLHQQNFMLVVMVIFIFLKLWSILFCVWIKKTKSKISGTSGGNYWVLVVPGVYSSVSPLCKQKNFYFGHLSPRWKQSTVTWVWQNDHLENKPRFSFSLEIKWQMKCLAFSMDWTMEDPWPLFTCPGRRWGRSQSQLIHLKCRRNHQLFLRPV